MMGLSTIGSISLGIAFVAGRNRVPSPAAGKTALRTLAGIASSVMGRVTLWRVRVVQYKMILKPKSIPTQDDPENGKVGVGELRQDAIADAECRRAESGADQRVLEGQPWDCVQRARPRRNICLDTAGSDRAGVRQPGQDGARGSSRLYHESNWAEPAAGGAADSDVPGDGEGRATAVSTAAVSAEVYRRGCDI